MPKPHEIECYERVCLVWGSNRRRVSRLAVFFNRAGNIADYYIGRGVLRREHFLGASSVGEKIILNHTWRSLSGIPLKQWLEETRTIRETRKG